jgi:5-methylcytosine-specific restriction protein A
MEILAKRRRTFCSDYCVHQWKLRSDPGYLRDQVFLRDKGVCGMCGTDTVAAYGELKRSRGKARVELLEVWGMRSVTARRSLWDADHIRAVAEGVGSVIWIICGRFACAATGRLRRICGGG